MVFKEIWEVLKKAGSDFVEDNASQLGAGLAFYSLLSLAPLVVIAVAIAGFVFGEQAARGEIVEQIEGMVGVQGAEAIETALANANRPETGTVATVLSIAMLLFGASGVFGQLRDALNTIWEIPPSQQSGWWVFLRDRFFPFMLVLGTGFLLLVSLILSATIAALAKYLERWLQVPEAVWHAVNFAASFAIVFLLFALIYKVLPAARVAWRDVWLGAAITAVLFLIGKLLLGLYLGKSGVGSAVRRGRIVGGPAGVDLLRRADSVLRRGADAGLRPSLRVALHRKAQRAGPASRNPFFEAPRGAAIPLSGR